MGAPVVHFELWSKDPARISSFYEQVFGWKINHVPEMNYRVVETGGKGGINGGIMQPKDGPWPGNMAFYLDVPDLDAAAAKVKAAGGTMIVEKTEIPGMGAFSLFSDPDGRVLGLWKSS